MKIYNGDCIEVLEKLQLDKNKHVLVIDPPFNIGYHYNSYHDKKKEGDYFKWLKQITSYFNRFVIIHYPESIFKLSLELGIAPTKTVSWVYPSNTAKQHRMIAYFNIKPNFRQMTQPYKNPNDKRIKERIANGSKGARLYDWWEINQVKNVSKEKTAHTCQMPIEVMERVIGVLPQKWTVVDCFMGSGTTGVACNKQNFDFIGIELDEFYFNISKGRLLND